MAKEREKQVRHDVMSHVYAYGVQCPKAKGIIHLGATSCYVGDNTDIIVMTEALKLVRKKLVNVIAELAKFAEEHKALPTLAFTHFQPAQPTTVGKRATLWMQEFLLDLEDLDFVQCPKAKGIIHLGATSCYVGDNTDIIVMTEALKLVRKKLVNVIAELAKFAEEHKALPTLAFTHFQPAQPTTVGKRATLWMQEFLLDLEDLDFVLSTMKLLGSKGTTGTQASFLELFDGDQETIDKIDPMIAQKMGFKECYPVSGQTYSRKVDTRVLNVLAGIAASAHKFSNDIRLLQHLKEVEEPFEKSQIGSSAMAYKRNPMRSERIASLSRFVMVDALNPAITSATQWFERTLDDSANKRLSVPEGFLAIDGILDLCLNVVDGLVVYPKVIEKRLRSELPFMATENIMMDAVKAGGDRQELHERIRELSMEAGRNVKVEGKDNNLLELIAADPAFNMTLEDLQKTMDPAKYTGRAAVQVDNFLKKVVHPVLEANKELLGMTLDLCLNVVDGLVVYPKVIEKRLRSELPFMATENIMMDAVKAGGDRQELHERIRELSMEAGRNVKVEGKDNNLLELIAADPAFNMTLEDLQKTMDPAKYTGRAAVQVDNFLKKVVNPVLEANKELLGMTAEINV